MTLPALFGYAAGVLFVLMAFGATWDARPERDPLPLSFAMALALGAFIVLHRL